jgi:AhpD family alkylhydroperoxidase
MTETLYHPTTPELAARRKELAPGARGVRELQPRRLGRRRAAGEDQELSAVAVAHVTQCPYCSNGHTRRARRKGASPEEIMEAIWVAAEMRAGGADGHATLALRAMSAAPSDETTP